MLKLPYTKTSQAIKGYSESTIAKKERADCVVRAIASASGMEYDKAHTFVSEKFNRKSRGGTPRFIPVMNSIGKLNRKKITPVSVKNGTKSLTVNSFSKVYNKGTYILNVKGHAFTIKDGNVIGNVEDAIKTRKILKAAWKIGTN